MASSASSAPSVDFDSFTESVFEPYLIEAAELQPEQLTTPLHYGKQVHGVAQSATHAMLFKSWYVKV